MRKFVEPDVADNPLYHDTWKLLKKYRDVVWSLELSVQHVRTKFEIEYGTSIEDFLDSVYLAGLLLCRIGRRSSGDDLFGGDGCDVINENHQSASHPDCCHIRYLILRCR